jgi:Tol biopolymer transport system component
MIALLPRAAVILFGLCALLLGAATLFGRLLPPSPELVYASDRDGDLEIYRLDINRMVDAQLTHNHEPDSQPAWSPDGLHIAFVGERDYKGEIYLMSPDGSGSERLTDYSGRDFSPSWSPDGNRIAFAARRTNMMEIMTIDVGDRTLRRLTGTDSLTTAPAWSPDGRHIAFVSDRDGQYNNDIYWMDSDGRNIRQLASTPGYDGMPSWTPDDRLLYTSGWEIFSIRLAAPYSATPTITLLSNGLEAYGTPVWSPDGRWLAFALYSPTEPADIYLMDTGCTGRADGCGDSIRRLTTSAGENISPSWKP